MNFKTIVLLVFVSNLMFAQTRKNKNEDDLTYNAELIGDTVIVKLSTKDPKTMMTMFHRGFSVYFDVKGKKKKNVAVTYPVELERPKRQQGPPNREEDEESRPSMTEMLNKLPREAEYKFYDESHDFHLDLNALDIFIAYSFLEEERRLDYELKIPKKAILKKGQDLSKLSIGIVSTKIEDESRPKMSMNMGGGGRQGGGPPSGGGGGGRGSGGGGMGGPPSGGNDGGPQQQGQRSQPESLNIWFEAEL